MTFTLTYIVEWAMIRIDGWLPVLVWPVGSQVDPLRIFAITLKPNHTRWSLASQLHFEKLANLLDIIRLWIFLIKLLMHALIRGHYPIETRKQIFAVFCGLFKHFLSIRTQTEELSVINIWLTLLLCSRRFAFSWWLPYLWCFESDCSASRPSLKHLVYFTSLAVTFSGLLRFGCWLAGPSHLILCLCVSSWSLHFNQGSS